MRIHTLPFAIACAVTMALSGCATPAAKAIKETNGDLADAEAKLKAVREQADPLNRPLTVVHTEQYVDTTVYKRDAEAPAAAAADCEVNYAPAGGVASVTDFVQILAAGKCHTLVRFDNSAMRRLMGGQESQAGAVATGPIPAVQTAPYGGGTMLPEVPGGPRAVAYNGGTGTGVERSIPLVYKGSLNGLLDRVAAILGLYYRRDGNRVEFFYTETKTYRINLKAEKTTQRSGVRSGMSATTGSQNSGMSSQSSGQSSGGSNDSGTTQNTDVEASQDIAKGIDEAVKAMLSPGDVGRYSYVHDTGQLIVTDTPDVQKNVAAYVTQTNHIVTQQVVMQVVVATFQKSRNNHLAFSWDLAFKSMRGKGVTLGNQFPLTDTNGSSLGVQILDTASGNLGNFAGSKVVLDALNEQGVAKVVQSPTIYSLNMQPTPMQTGTQYTYLAESSNSITSGGTATGFSQTSLIPGLVTTGFNIVATPFVYEDGETMTLSFSMNLSQLDKITDIQSQNSKIQAPQVSNNIVVQKVKIRSGETMVISGMKGETKKADESGVGHPKWWLFGGGYNHDESDTVSIIMVTPIIQKDAP